jgi:hypothetical protein
MTEGSEELRSKQVKQQAAIVEEEIQITLESVSEIKKAAYRQAVSSKIFGKTAEEWHNELSLVVDQNADPAKVKYLASQLSQKLNKAQANLAKSKQMFHKYKLSYYPHFNQEISKHATHKGRKVMPAMDSMRAVAENDLGDRSIAYKEFENLVEFWRDIVYKLINSIELLKITSMSNGTQNRIGEY